MPQDQTFWNGEGDRWWERNRSKLKTGEDLVLNVIERNSDHLKLETVLDVGCATGWRIAKIQDQYGSICYGVDASENAINEGKIQFPNLKLTRALASKLPFGSLTFDLVIINFLFCWISRQALLNSVAELDRVLKHDGHLVIGDFLPYEPTEAKYHHLPDQGVKTYKQDYAELFLATKWYQRQDILEFNHDAPTALPPFKSEYRAAVQLLKKIGPT